VEEIDPPRNEQAEATSILNSHYDVLTATILSAASDTVPPAPSKLSMKICYSADPKLVDLKVRHARLRRRLMNKSVNQPSLRAARKHRSWLNKQIKKRIRELQNARVMLMVTELEKNRSNARGFAAARILKKTSSTSPNLRIKDNNGTTCSNPTQLIGMIDEWYMQFYNQQGIDAVHPWIGEPGALLTPITLAEVQMAVKKLNNGRATGLDQVSGELLKYGPEKLHIMLCSLFNDIFITHSHIDAIGAGILIPLNKPGKEAIAQNTRPITLLNSARKTLSLILLERIYPIIDRYISPGQSGFRRSRSTTDVIWSYRWIAATAQKFKQQEFHVMGIDLSKAFDCIDRPLLLRTIQSMVPISEYRILTYLLSHTTLQTRIKGQLGPKFTTSIGTPQGDALSPILFIFYLEAALRVYRDRVPVPSLLHLDLSYADDKDFVALEAQHLEDAKTTMPAALQSFNLTENASKREEYLISKTTFKELSNKKLGSKISDKHDLKYRICQAAAAFSKFWKIWGGKSKWITLETKLRMYNSFIKPILTYNIAALAVTTNQAFALDSTHRRHLRHMLRIYYPNTITNKQLYNRTQSHPISHDLLPLRWQLFGHILRQDKTIPANIIMEHYFTLRGPRYPGATCTTLPSLLHANLSLINRRLMFHEDLIALRELAQDRAQWSAQTAHMNTKHMEKLAQEEAQKQARRALKRQQNQQLLAEPVAVILNPPVHPSFILHITRRTTLHQFVTIQSGNKRIRLNHYTTELTLNRNATRSRDPDEAQARDQAIRVRREEEEDPNSTDRRSY
jgi:hypothetical protein